ncbi:MAG: chemotaxis response regulator protein-glutamate methylesterase [Halochromatium sp.]|uniref:protein-glutamate methylesterase/protein-glutamine glutaminase n=1 Tax=Halochromatium sp. TaxID=2049430 RepID=UPI00397978FD
MIKVLIVDDSALVRQGLSELLGSDSHIEVVGTAADPYAAVEKMRRLKPDVITLDVEMPRMDGLTFLRRIMSQHPIPVVICSTLTTQGSDTLMQALEAGAVTIITKPSLVDRLFFEESRLQILDAVKSAAQAQLKKLIPSPKLKAVAKQNADAVLPLVRQSALRETTDKIVAIGASTGGTEALRLILQTMPVTCPPLVVVQHMPEVFTRSFSQRLNALCGIRVKEAENNDSLLPGQALIAPGNKHLLVKRSGARYYVEIADGPLVSRHRPSVDVLFRSTAQSAGSNAVGVILTGMGDDGATGLKEMRDAGARTLGQDEHSSVVYGMPREAWVKGGVEKQVSLELMTASILKVAL